MQAPWRKKLLGSTRGRVVSLLRYAPRTVNELAATLDLTDNAVRLHLSTLERDGLVEPEGVRRGVGKPATIYRLTGEAESLFPKAYATLLSEALGYVRDKEGDAGLEAFLREVGRRAGERARTNDSSQRDRIDAAVAVLGELGGLAEVQEDENGLVIRGFSCPLAAVMETNPEACLLAEELVSTVVGTEVQECCDREGTPKCAFRITTL